jgi:hypothetical protein
MKSEHLIKSVASYVTVVLILLSAVCYSDEFEYIQNPSEKAIHQEFSGSSDQVSFISDEYPGVPGSKQFISIPVVYYHLVKGFTPSTLPASLRHGPSRGNKLFLLLSTYRI